MRLEQCGIITRSTMVHVFRTIGRGWRKDEPMPIHDDCAELARRFERLCFRALSERRISPAKAAELLGRHYKQIQQQMRGPAGAGGRQ
jgi:hypothetical protein